MKRNYGIDLLRLVLMFMVCILHTLGQGGVLRNSESGTTGYFVFWLFEIFAYCAVDGFALISGYTAQDRPQKYTKIVDMWFQAFFYSFAVTLVLWVMGIGEFEIKHLIKAAMPVTFGYFWYFTAYFALFFALPVLNRFLFEIDEKNAKKALILLVVLFSVLGTLYDPFRSQAGYSAIWLIVLYCVGVLAKRVQVFEKRKTGTLIIVWMLCVFITWVVHVFLNISRLTSYTSPTVLLSAAIMVTLFSRLKIKGTIVKKTAPLAFGIYLFQLNGVLWNNVLNGVAASIATINIGWGVLCVFGVAGLIFMSGLLVEFLRATLMKALRFPTLSEKIVILADWMIEKMFVFLK